jgi:hypothetical protein
VFLYDAYIRLPKYWRYRCLRICLILLMISSGCVAVYVLGSLSLHYSAPLHIYLSENTSINHQNLWTIVTSSRGRCKISHPKLSAICFLQNSVGVYCPTHAPLEDDFIKEIILKSIILWSTTLFTSIKVHRYFSRSVCGLFLASCMRSTLRPLRWKHTLIRNVDGLLPYAWRYIPEERSFFILNWPNGTLL